MTRKIVLPVILAAILTVWIAPQVWAGAVGSRFDITLFGKVEMRPFLRNAIMVGDGTDPIFAIPRQLRNTFTEERNDTRQEQFNASVSRTQINLRLTGPDLWGAKTSGLIQWDFNQGGLGAAGSAGGITNVGTPASRLRHAFFDLDWAGKTISTKLKIGSFFTIGHGFPVMSIQSVPFFGGGLGYPFEPQIAFWHTIKINPKTSLMIQYAAFWNALAAGPAGQLSRLRNEQSDADAPGFAFETTLRSVLYGKKPVTIAAGFHWVRVDVEVTGEGAVFRFPSAGDPGGLGTQKGDSYNTNIYISIPLFAGLSFAAKGNWGQGDFRSVSNNTLGVIRPAPWQSNAKTIFPRNYGWFTTLSWEATPKWTFNGAYGQTGVNPQDVPRRVSTGSPVLEPIVATGVGPNLAFFENQWEYLFNVWYKASPNITLAAQWHKRHAKYANARERFNPVANANYVVTRDAGGVIDVKDGGADLVEFLFRYDF